MDLTLTMTKNVDLENSSNLELLDLFIVLDTAFGRLSLESLEMDPLYWTVPYPGCRLVTLAFYHLETPGYMLLLMDYREYAPTSQD